MSEVDVAPFRERFLELRARGVTASAIAIRADWVRSDKGTGDTVRLKRALGLLPNTTSRSPDYRYVAKRMRYDIAVRLAEAMDLDPVDMGL